MDPVPLFLAVCLFTVLGAGLGIITGLVPGVHVNNVALMVVALSPALAGFIIAIFGQGLPVEEVSILMVAIIVGCLITHTFLDVIPSVFLGAPDPDMALSVLPGHRLMLEGKGYAAIKCSALGSFGAVLMAMIFLLPTRLLMGSPVNAYDKMWPFIHLILIFIVLLLILNEGGEGVPLRLAKKSDEMHKLVKLQARRIEGVKYPQPPLLELGDDDDAIVRGKIIKNPIRR